MSHPNLYFTDATLKNNILLYMESAIFFCTHQYYCGQTIRGCYRQMLTIKTDDTTLILLFTFIRNKASNKINK